MKYFDFFNRVKQWAKENNTTIEAVLSEATHGLITKGVYQGWRIRSNLPSGEYCYDIAQYMGVSCDWLISGKDYLADSADARLQLLARYGDFLRDFEALDESSRFAVTQLAHTLAASKPQKASTTQSRAV